MSEIIHFLNNWKCFDSLENDRCRKNKHLYVDVKCFMTFRMRVEKKQQTWIIVLHCKLSDLQQCNHSECIQLIGWGLSCWQAGLKHKSFVSKCKYDDMLISVLHVYSRWQTFLVLFSALSNAKMRSSRGSITYFALAA